MAEHLRRAATGPVPEEARGLRADARRNLRNILQAAADLLARDPDASMIQVAEAAGLHRATLYRHFPNREDLVFAIHLQALEDAHRAIEAAEPERGDAAQALGRVVTGLASVGERYRIVAGTEEFADELGPLREAIGAQLIGLVARGQQQGSLRRDLSPRWIVLAMVHLVIGALADVTRGEMRGEDVAAHVTAVLMRGVGAAGPAGVPVVGS